MVTQKALARYLESKLPEPCGREEYWCLCRLDRGHKGNHDCECGGSWAYDAEGEFVPVTFPHIRQTP